jgi:hypothetical protein
MGRPDASLGQRIIDAARAALVLHLAQDAFEQKVGQQEMAGGAATLSSTDGTLPNRAKGAAA